MFTVAEMSSMYRATGGVLATFGASSTYGHLEAVNYQRLAFYQEVGGVGQKVTTFTYATGGLPGLDVDDTLTVDGTAYVVRWNGRDPAVQDGGVSLAYLAEG
jgi:hypothetical protein